MGDKRRELITPLLFEAVFQNGKVVIVGEISDEAWRILEGDRHAQCMGFGGDRAVVAYLVRAAD